MLKVFKSFFWERIILNVKWAEVSWAKLHCKMCDLFCYFLLALKLSARKSEIKKKLRWYSLEHLEKYNNFVCPQKYFQEIIPNMIFFNYLNFGSNVVFWGTVLGYFLLSASHCGRHFCSDTSTIKSFLRPWFCMNII